MTDLTGDGGILKQTTEEGTGPVPKAGQRVWAHYTGKLADGTVFDSSIGKVRRARKRQWVGCPPRVVAPRRRARWQTPAAAAAAAAAAGRNLVLRPPPHTRVSRHVPRHSRTASTASISSWARGPSSRGGTLASRT
jgi:hypothetical protein